MSAVSQKLARNDSYALQRPVKYTLSQDLFSEARILNTKNLLDLWL